MGTLVRNLFNWVVNAYEVKIQKKYSTGWAKKIGSINKERCWFLVARYGLLVSRYSLLVAGSSLLVTRFSLLITQCSSWLADCQVANAVFNQ
jgi:hypothetical protein